MTSPEHTARLMVGSALSLWMVAGGLSFDARAAGQPKLQPTHRPMSVAQLRLFNDPPRSHLDAGTHSARLDTLWWGGVDAGGLALPGGVWDFEDGTLQGWTSIDRTGVPTRFRRIVPADCVTHGDPVCAVMTSGGSQASLWVGWHEDEATARCWPGGQGYGNSEGHNASKSLTYSGSGTVTVS